MMTCKAYNGRVVLQWLAETISSVSQQDGASDLDDRIGPIALCLFLAMQTLMLLEANLDDMA